MTDELAACLRQQLAAFHERQPAVFGANGHRFRLNELATEAEVAAFEAEHGIALPADYRWFITRVGNGGAGPYYGMFPLGQVEEGESLKTWQDAGVAGALTRPFPHRESWNDLTGRLDEEGESDETYEEFNRRYFAASLVEGAFPLCHMGCALWVWLVVSGPEAGHLWYDTR